MRLTAKMLNDGRVLSNRVKLLPCFGDPAVSDQVGNNMENQSSVKVAQALAYWPALNVTPCMSLRTAQQPYIPLVHVGKSDIRVF